MGSYDTVRYIPSSDEDDETGKLDEKSRLLLIPRQFVSPAPRPRPLARRWYILLLFSALTFGQSTVWNTWGPIAQSAKYVFPQWTNKTIALLSAWGSITYLIFMVPMCWLLNAKGLRRAIIVTGSLQLLGTGMRCIRLSSVCIHLGQFLNGIAGVVLNASPSMLSTIWFPVHERTTATAIACQTATLGTAVAFVLGNVVQPPAHISNVSAVVDADDSSTIKDDITRLMAWEFLATFILMCCIVFYFPSRPLRPPSYSACVRRATFKESIVTLLRSKDFLWLLFAYGIAVAVFGCWTSVMDLTLDGIGISQRKAGWLGFYMTVAGTLGSILVARLSDVFSRKLKSIILFFLFVATLCYVVFILVVYKVISVGSTFLYVLLITMSLCIQSLNPLFYELAAEMTYPVDEGVIAGVLSGMWNVIGTLFLLLFFIPDIGVIWMNWCLLFSSIVAIPLVWLAKEVYRRSAVDGT